LWKRSRKNGYYGPIRERAGIEDAEWHGFWEYRPSSSVGAGNPYFRIWFKPTKTVKYDGSQLSEFQVDAFYVPMSSKQVAFDSFKLVVKFCTSFSSRSLLRTKSKMVL
jgi:hypothetical protein